MNTVVRPSTPHLKVLDGLRGFMALWVWLGHCCVLAQARFPGLEETGIPVEVFMFLSGFVMAWNHFLDERPWTGRGSEAIAFYIKRFFRLSPLYYTLLIPAILFLGPIKEATWLGKAEHSAHIPVVANIAIHTSYLFGLFPATASNNILPDWSLSLEMQFYALFPLLIIMLKRMGDLTFLFLTIFLMYATERVVSLPDAPAHHALIYYPVTSLLTFNLPLFAIGMVSARFIRSGLAKVGVGAMFGCGVAATFHQYLLVPIILLLAVLALAEVRAVAVRVFSALMQSRFGLAMGNLSYSVYLIHMIFVFAAQALLQDRVWYVHLEAHLKFGILVGLTAPLVVISAAFTFRFIERPGIALGNRLIRGMQQA